MVWALTAGDGPDPPPALRQASCSREGTSPRTTGDAGKGDPLRYYIRQQRKHVSGPFELTQIEAWVKEGKVRQEMEFSEDGEEWMLGLEMIELFGERTPRRRAAPRPRKRRRLWGS